MIGKKYRAQPSTINISNQTETGRWSDITDQKNISKELVSADVFKLWFNHGDKINETDIHGKRKMDKSPSYQYIVVPDISEQKLAETSANNRNIEILSNTMVVVTLPSIYTTKGEGFSCLPNEKGNTTMVIVDLPQGVYLGKSVTVKF
jgi:Polysaccharide lyase family 8, super-sandwich domain